MVQVKVMPWTVHKKGKHFLKESQVKVGFPPHPVIMTGVTESITLFGRVSKFWDALEWGEGEVKDD